MRQPVRQFELGDPANHVEFSRTECVREQYGCLVCRFQKNMLAKRCRPFNGKVFCGKFEPERAGGE